MALPCWRYSGTQQDVVPILVTSEDELHKLEADGWVDTPAKLALALPVAPSPDTSTGEVRVVPPAPARDNQFIPTRDVSEAIRHAISPPLSAPAPKKRGRPPKRRDA